MSFVDTATADLTDSQVAEFDRIEEEAARQWADSVVVWLQPEPELRQMALPEEEPDRYYGC